MAQTAEEIEAETKAIEAKLAAIRAKKAAKSGKPIPRPKRDGDRLREIQADQRVKGHKANVALEHPCYTDSHGITWYRPERPPGTTLDQWGWTSQKEYAHPDYELPWSSPKTPLGKLERLMDRTRKAMEEHVAQHGVWEGDEEYGILKGRYQGIAASIATLRKSKVSVEVQRSNGRLGIE